MSNPLRGEVWRADLDPVRGHEQAGTRPVLIISDDILNTSAAGLFIGLPITSKSKFTRSHVAVAPPEGGLTLPSFIKCEDVRSLSTDRLHGRLGRVSPETLEAVEYRLRVLMKL